MRLTASERATLNFYQWEYRGRGYYHFDKQVDIEPPYVPFQFKSYTDSPQIDDGRIPTLFDRAVKLIEGKPKKTNQEQEEINPIPNPARSILEGVGFSLVFTKGEEISSIISVEFLNMLSFTDAPLSFEILGTSESITIQLVCSKTDAMRVHSHLKAYFPTGIIQEKYIDDVGFDFDRQVAIADFGLSDEFMRPIYTPKSLNIDPLTSIIAILDNLQYGDIALFQVIFQGVTAPWAKDITYAVSDGQGGSFFGDAPEMVKCAGEKVSSPLFSCVLRVATQGNSDKRSQYLTTELARSITSVSISEYNRLIPLTNEGYNYDDHLFNVFHRTTNRLGMILNSEELVSFVHYPNKSIVSSKIGIGSKTKLIPQECVNQRYVLGINEHNGVETTVTIDDEARLRHTHIIGATGVGKSTLIANMIFEDIKHGNGCALFDPHGDICEDILARISEYRKDDVIIIDPSDSDFPIGFNLLGAKTDIEKIVLSSDLVSAFKQRTTSWGDNIQAVLSNAINTFLESSKSGTLIELKRFLLEESFRKQFLESVDDQSIHYYWQYEYPLVKKGIAPLLTRIDTFLRPKIVRSMLAQTDGIDFKTCIEEKKIILIKLSQGLIGEDNSYLLGSLFLSKLNQAIRARQSISKEERHPYYIYLDEFQNFITPSITSILSGARKYGLGLILTHQELTQIDDIKTLNSVISNPNIRICFRLGDNDASKLENGFSYFEQDDLQSLGIGQAIIRVGISKNDFNLTTDPLQEIDSTTSETIKASVVQNTRSRYAKPKKEVQKILDSLLPKFSKKEKNSEESPQTIRGESENGISDMVEPTEGKSIVVSSPFEEQKQAYLKQAEEQETISKHRSLQNYVKTMARQRGFKATLEEEIKNGRVDVGLTKGKIRIAVEISVTNTIDYEVQNIQKCVDAKYNLVFLICENQTHLENIRKSALKVITKKSHKLIHFFESSRLSEYLDALEPKGNLSEKRVRGFRVKLNYSTDSDGAKKKKSLTEIIMQALRKRK